MAGAEIQQAANQRDDPGYLIQPGDILSVDFYLNPEFNDDPTVRPDGKVTMRLIGDIQASNNTPQQVEGLVAERLKSGGFILDPYVSVGLQAVHSKKYYIQGEVNRPGAYDLVVPTTVLEALVNAGGFKDFANTKKIRILRVKEKKDFNFNYKEVSAGKRLEQNILLLPGDQIFVK